MKAKEWIHQKRVTFLYYIFRFFPIKKNKVVFCNYIGKGYGCNPKYIAKELINETQNWDLVWMTKNTNGNFPPQIRTVFWESTRAIYDLATSSIWIDNQRKLPHHKKRKKQFFIETWHGGLPLKKIGADNPNNFNNLPYEKTSKHMNKIVNLMISNGPDRTEIYRRAFLYTGKILECGTPRDDILINGDKKIKEIINQSFELDNDTKTILYAPTYRNGRKLDFYTFEPQSIINAFQKKFGGKWVLLIRLHPTMDQKADTLTYNKNIINASKYEDTQELLAGCDILISDYSSVVSEFALTKKPIFLYASDLDKYLKERDFYLNYMDLPFPISKNNQMLINHILSYNENNYRKKVDEYFNKISFCEKGNASKVVVQEILKWNETL